MSLLLIIIGQKDANLSGCKKSLKLVSYKCLGEVSSELICEPPKKNHMVILECSSPLICEPPKKIIWLYWSAVPL